MTNVEYLRLPTAEEALVERRTQITNSTYDLVRQGGQSLRNLPTKIRDALTVEAWKDRRTPNGAPVSNSSFLDWVMSPYPYGIEASTDLIRKLIADEPAALVLFDEAVQARPGGANNPAGSNQHQRKEAPVEEVTLYNIQGDQPARAPTGTSREASVRRLRKAADAGDPKAVDLLEKVKSGEVKPNRARIEMGWAKPTVTVTDDADAFVQGAVKRIGTAELARRAVLQMSNDERLALLVFVATEVRFGGCDRD
jgi:hypothetical protein